MGRVGRRRGDRRKEIVELKMKGMEEKRQEVEEKKCRGASKEEMDSEENRTQNIEVEGGRDAGGRLRSG